MNYSFKYFKDFKDFCASEKIVTALQELKKSTGFESKLFIIVKCVYFNSA